MTARVLTVAAVGLALLSCRHRDNTQVEQPRVTFAAHGEAAPTYRSEPSDEPALRGPHGQQLAGAIEQANAERKLSLTPDGRLGQLAEWIAGGLDASGSSPPYPVTELWVRHLGLPEPTPHTVVLIGPSDSLIERAVADLAPLFAQQRYTHFGAAAFDRDNGSVVAVFVLSWRWLTLRPVPRVVAPGARLQLSGHIDDELREPQLVVTEPNGISRRLGAQPGHDFNAEVTAPQGELRVELLADSPRGVVVVANFPVYAGMPPPTEVTVAVPAAGGEPLDEGAVVQRLLELVNLERARVHVPALVLDRGLSAVAQAHSQDMHDHRFVGHTSPTTGSASDRVKRAGIRTTVVLENIGRGYGADEVHRGLMDSPGHRDNVLSPDVTHIGIGVLRENDQPKAAYLVTEVSVLRASEIDVDDAPAQLLDLINAQRVRRGIKPIGADEDMASLAGDTAQAFFTDQRATQQQLLEALNHKATARASTRGAASERYKRMVSVLTVVSSLSEARGIEALLDPQVRAVGFGVAQGTRSDSIPNAIAIVALIGY